MSSFVIDLGKRKGEVMHEDEFIIEDREGRVGRRSVLRGALLGGAGLAAAALIGCGDDSEDDGNEPAADGGSPAAMDMGDDKRGRYVKDPNLQFPYNFPEPQKEPKAGGTLNVAATWDVGPMDPSVSAAGGTIVVPNMVYNRLLGIKGGPDVDLNKLTFEPELATSWERSPDGLTYTFKIKPGVKWQNIAPLNGRPFVAADAKFAYERYSREGVHKSYWVNVNSIEAVDDSTLKITLKKATADFISPLAGRYQTIFPHELVDDGSITKRVIGTGPMILKEAVAGQHVTFEKNPDYWERRVLLDGAQFKMVPDASARLAAFRAGQAEYAYAVADTKDAVEALLSTNKGLQINHTLPSFNTIPFGMNLSHDKFKDERVRRAIALAIDTATMSQIVFQGLSKTLPLLPWAFVYDQEPTAQSGALGKWWRHDPKEAKQLLQAAGSEGLTFNNAYFPYGAYLDRLAELLVPMFKEAGITMTGGKVDYTEFNSQWVGGKLAEVTTSGWLSIGFDADAFFYNIPHSKSPGNRWKLNDPQMDQWAEQQQVELVPSARREIHKKMLDRSLDQMYWPPVPAQIGFEIYQPWLRGIRFGGPLSSNSSYYDWGDQIGEAWLDK